MIKFLYLIVLVAVKVYTALQSVELYTTKIKF